MKLFMIATIVFMAARNSYAQPASVPNPLPNTAWPMDSVVRGMVKKFTVTGDKNYDEASTFIWNVKGGRIFLDADTLVLATAFNTDTLKGNSDNKSSIWVVWDRFEQPLDTGYVYVYERSANNCERGNTDQNKYVGRRVKVSSPPKAFFLKNQTLVCSDQDSVSIILKVQGMAPYDITYTKDGVEIKLHLTQNDMHDFDLDGEAEEYAFVHKGFKGTTTDREFRYELLEASSGGVIGTIDMLQGYATHNLLVHVIPATPEIFVDWIEVTEGQTHSYYMSGDVNTSLRLWQLFNENDELVYEYSSATMNHVDITFNYPTGHYYLLGSYIDTNALGIDGCETEADRLNIEVFATPTIGFVDVTDIVTCSAVSLVATEKFEFEIEYQGARPYSFDLVLKDYNGDEIFRQKYDTESSNLIQFSYDNILINEAEPEMDRIWTLEIQSPINNEKIDVTIVQDHGVSKLIIHPKPFIEGNIDFEN